MALELYCKHFMALKGFKVNFLGLISMHKTTYVSTLQKILFKSNLLEFLAHYFLHKVKILSNSFYTPNFV